MPLSVGLAVVVASSEAQCGQSAAYGPAGQTPIPAGLIPIYEQAGGLLSGQPEDSTELERYGDPGPGRWITVYANSQHTFVAIAGIEFDTSDAGNPATATPPGSGPRWRPDPTGNLADGLIYTVRHPPGL